MHSMIRKSLLVPAVLLAAASAVSAMSETVKVPFNFRVGNTLCPAGRYSIHHDDTANFVSMVGLDSPQAFTWVLNATSPNATERKTTLEFDDVDQTRTLHAVRYRGLSTDSLDRKEQQARPESRQLSGGR